MILADYPKTKYSGNSNITITDISVNSIEYYNKIKSNYILQKYSIEGSDRPETVSYKLYGTVDYAWILLLINDCVDPFNDWILSPQSCIQRSKIRWATMGGVDQVHHHEDEQGRKWYGVVEDGSSGNWYTMDEYGNKTDNLVYIGTMVPVTVSEFELSKNEEKRVINIIKQKSIDSFVQDMVNQIQI